MKTLRRFKLPFTSSVLWLAVSAVSPVDTVTLRGGVEFRGSVRPPAYDESIYGYRPPTAVSMSPLPRRAVVYLVDLDGNLEPTEAPEPVAIDQKNEMFVPRILAIQKGTRVDFPNSDTIYHNVFSFSSTKRFDLGRYPRGESRSVLFDREGVVRIFCEIHSHMSAFVLVLPHSYFAVTDESGAFTITNIPPGRYEVVVWNDQYRSVRQEIDLGGSDALRLDLVLDEPR